MEFIRPLVDRGIGPPRRRGQAQNDAGAHPSRNRRPTSDDKTREPANTRPEPETRRLGLNARSDNDLTYWGFNRYMKLGPGSSAKLV